MVDLSVFLLLTLMVSWFLFLFLKIPVLKICQSITLMCSLSWYLFNTYDLWNLNGLNFFEMHQYVSRTDVTDPHTGITLTQTTLLLLFLYLSYPRYWVNKMAFSWQKLVVLSFFLPRVISTTGYHLEIKGGTFFFEVFLLKQLIYFSLK